jgi:hypothetical protein
MTSFYKKTFFLFLILITFIIGSCSNNTNQLKFNTSINQKTFLNGEELNQLDKEFGQFKIKSLSKNYLKKKLIKWKNLGISGEKQLVKEIEFARIKNPALFCAVMKENNDIRNYINSSDSNNLIEIYNRKNIQPSFATFLDSGCVPDLITSGLILSLDAGNPDSYPGSGTIWNDLSGNGNNGILVNNAGFSSENGGSIVLDGIDDYVAVPNTSGQFNLGTGDFTMAVWINLTDSASYTHLINLDNQTNFSFKVGPAEYDRVIYFYGGESYRSSFSNWFLNLNEWTYLCLSRNGTTHKAYTNGALISSFDLTPKSLSTTNIYIGGIEPREYTPEKRAINQIYNRALSDSEILQNYNATKARFGF